jgi:hypothetical protein
VVKLKEVKFPQRKTTSLVPISKFSCCKMRKAEKIAFFLPWFDGNLCVFGLCRWAPFGLACTLELFPFDRGHVEIHGGGTHTNEFVHLSSMSSLMFLRTDWTQSCTDDTGNSLRTFPVSSQVSQLTSHLWSSHPHRDSDRHVSTYPSGSH